MKGKNQLKSQGNTPAQLDYGKALMGQKGGWTLKELKPERGKIGAGANHVFFIAETGRRLAATPAAPPAPPPTDQASPSSDGESSAAQS